MQNHESHVKNSLKRKKRLYKINEKLQVDITKLKGKNIYLIAENAYLVAKVIKLKSLYYLNKQSKVLIVWIN